MSFGVEEGRSTLSGFLTLSPVFVSIKIVKVQVNHFILRCKRYTVSLQFRDLYRRLGTSENLVKVSFYTGSSTSKSKLKENGKERESTEPLSFDEGNPGRSKGSRERHKFLFVYFSR